MRFKLPVLSVTLVLAILMLGCVMPRPTTPAKTPLTTPATTITPTPKKALIVLFRGFQPREYNPVKRVLTEGGVEVKVLAVNKDVGVEYDYYVGDIEDLASFVKEYDAVIIIGGPGVYMRVTGRVKEPNMPLVKKLVVEAYKMGKWVCAICAAPAILAKAGLLKGKKATCFPSNDLISILKGGGAKYTGGDVEVDGKVITSRGPETADKFAKAILKALKGGS